jgi:TolA-binding protein
MKAQERHHLKQNDFVATVARVSAWFVQNRDRVMMGAVAVVVVIVVGGGYLFWRKHTSDQASAMFGAAMAIVEAPIAPASTLPGAGQTPGTYPTDKARQEAALAAFQQVATSYPSTDSGIAARYQAAAALLTLGRLNEAEQAFQDVAGKGSSLYSSMARLGVAETLVAEGQYDKAIKAYTDLSADRDGPLPVDGVLMQLARACMKAGKPAEARAAFKRVVDEFPESNFVTEARQKLALL